MEDRKIDKATLKLALKELIKEDKTLFKEIIIENQAIAVEKQGVRKQKIEQLIELDFDKYDDVFKALA